LLDQLANFGINLSESFVEVRTSGGRSKSVRDVVFIFFVRIEGEVRFGRIDSGVDGGGSGTGCACNGVTG